MVPIRRIRRFTFQVRGVAGNHPLCKSCYREREKGLVRRKLQNFLSMLSNSLSYVDFFMILNDIVIISFTPRCNTDTLLTSDVQLYKFQ